MNRRAFVASSLATGTTAYAGSVWSAPNAPASLLVVFLRGGYDGASLLVPTSSEFYYQSRPNIAIAKPDPLVAGSAIPLSDDWGLHPTFKDNVYGLWEKRQLSFVPFAGTEDMSRSHFETQNSMELGRPLVGGRDYSSGFLGRLTREMQHPRSISFTSQLPLILSGEVPAANIDIESVARNGVSDDDVRLIEGMYPSGAIRDAIAEGFNVKKTALAAQGAEMSFANRGAMPTGGFEAAARRIARLMKAGFNVGFVDVGGWDTHVNQGASVGYLQGRFLELGRGITGLADELGERSWTKTVVLVISEFGRTVKENGDRGTDHGHGGVFWVAGGAISGGKVLGNQILIKSDNLNEGRDYPVLNEYRSISAGLFKRMFGFTNNQLSRIFPEAVPKDIALI